MINNKKNTIYGSLVVRLITALASWSLDKEIYQTFIAWFDQYVQFITRLHKKTGLENAVATVKIIQLHVTRYLSGNPLLVNSLIIGLTHDGLPKILKGLLPYVRSGNVMVIRLLLTVFFVIRMVLGRIIPDTSPITTPSSADPNTIKAVAAFAPTFFMWLGIKVVLQSWKLPHLSTKKGPQGQALGTALYDLSILPASLLEAIYAISNGHLKDYMEALLGIIRGAPRLFGFFFKGLVPGLFRRISVIPDKALKSRIIAVFDYWSQTALLPLHNSLIAFLKKIHNDCTFYQGKISSLMVTFKVFMCYDLTAATDRFPVQLQTAILAELFGSAFASAWKTILVEYSFHMKGKGDVLYGAGQPIGAYSSWTVFALCHHIVVQYAASLAGYTSWYSNYALLGDDLVIGDKDVGHHYKIVMLSLGVIISSNKTHEGNLLCEFAKRFWLKGVEITPFPIVGLVEAIIARNPYAMALLVVQSLSCGWAHLLRTGAGSFLLLLANCVYSSARDAGRLHVILLEFTVLILLAAGEAGTAYQVHCFAMNSAEAYHLHLSCNWKSSVIALEQIRLEEALNSISEIKKTLRSNLDKATRIAQGLAGSINKEYNEGEDNHSFLNYHALYHMPWYLVIRNQLDVLNQLEIELQGGAISLEDAIDLLSKIRVSDPSKINTIRNSEMALRHKRTQMSAVRRTFRSRK